MSSWMVCFDLDFNLDLRCGQGATLVRQVRTCFCSVSEMVVVIYVCIRTPMPHFLNLIFLLTFNVVTLLFKVEIGEGPIVSVNHMESASGSTSVLVYATQMGGIRSWDLR